MKKKKMTQINYSYPVMITIENLKNETLHDVELLDFEHEKQKRIKYSTGIPSLSYNHVLRRMASYHKPFFNIRLLRNATENKQQLECKIELVNNGRNGKTFTDKRIFQINAFQQSTNHCDMDLGIGFPYYVETSILIKELLPKTIMTMHLYLNVRNIKIKKVYNPIKLIKKLFKNINLKKF